MQANGAALGVESFIWQDTWNPILEQGEAHRLGRQGANEGHYNHLHIKMRGGGMPKGNEQYKMPAVGGAGMNPALAQLLGGLPPNVLGPLLQALPGGGFLGGVTSDMLTGNATGGDGKVDPTTQFLSTIASTGGANLLSIGASFLSGITGIDFNSLIGTGQRIGGALIDTYGPKKTDGSGGSTPASSGLDSLIPGLGGLLGGGGGSGASNPGADASGAVINGIVNGQLPLESPNIQNALADTGFNQNLDGTSPSGGGNGQVSSADITAAVDQVAPMLGIKNKSAWVSALVKASNGSGGIFPSEGSGVQRATAALMTAVRDWGIDPQSGAPLTPKYAMGGGASKGLAWLSNGEFRTNPSATSYYGSGLFNALNAKAIPRDAARRMMGQRFDSGGWPGSADPNKQPSWGNSVNQLYWGSQGLLSNNTLDSTGYQGVPNSTGMNRNSQGLWNATLDKFAQPGLKFDGWRQPDVTPYGTFTEHSSGQAPDFYIPQDKVGTPEGNQLGSAIKDFTLQNGAGYALWDQAQWNPDGTKKGMAARDGSPTMRHTNHVHPRVYPDAKTPPLVDRSPRKSLGDLMLPGYAGGGWPMPLADPLLTPPAAGGQAAGPLPLQPPAPLPPAPEVPVPDVSVGAQQDTVPVPSTGGEPGPGATAPAPDPGSLPGVADALSGVGGGMGGGLPQPGAAGPNEGDPRGTLGSAPTSQNHNSPVVSGAISGIASSVGSIASMAAQAGMMAGTMGGSAAIPGAGGAAGAGIQAGAQMAGAIATGAVNILSSLLVGTATNGSTASASGIPLLPQRQEMQTGVPAMQGGGRVHNGDIYVTNLDEYRRTNERMDAQAAMPFIGKY